MIFSTSLPKPAPLLCRISFFRGLQTSVYNSGAEFLTPHGKKNELPYLTCNMNGLNVTQTLDFCTVCENTMKNIPPLDYTVYFIRSCLHFSKFH